MQKKIIVGIDISMLVYDGSGVANYTYNFCKRLLKFAPQYKYKFFYSSRRVPLETQKKLNELKRMGAKIYKYPFPPWFLTIIWNRFQVLPIHWLIGKYDAFHSSDYLRPPLLKNSKNFTTIHDLTWKKFPEFHTDDIIKKHARKLEKTITFGDRILVDSKNTASDLMEYYPFYRSHKNLVHTLYLGIDERYAPQTTDNINGVLKRYNLNPSAPFLLYVGAIEPRKNLLQAIEVFAILRQKDEYNNLHFYLIGRAGWKNEEIFAAVKKYHLEKKVIFIGYVPDGDIPAFYTATQCLMYLSKYEGFGLPPLEVLACGSPVIAGKNSSLVEILDEKYLTPLEDSEYIVKKLDTILSLPKPATNTFQPSWQKYIQQFIAIIEQ